MSNIPKSNSDTDTVMSVPHHQEPTPIGWPETLAADKGMTYESLDLLYKVSTSDDFGDQIGLILSCSRHILPKAKNLKGLLHKVELTTLPSFAQAQIEVTHEVKPGLDPCAQILPVNEQLKVACFDSGCIIPIKNFGHKKTFNSEVASRLAHHTGQICCMAANATGNKFATGCTKGMITLYQVCQDDISFLSRTEEMCNTIVTGMTFMKNRGTPTYGLKEVPPFNEECLLIYSTNHGGIYLMDTRCSLAAPIDTTKMFDLNPRIGITSLLHPRSPSGSLIYIGGCNGQLVVCDLRMNGRPLIEVKAKHDEPIVRMKEVIIKDGSLDRTFVAFSNSTNEIEILDLDTMQPDANWLCDRPSAGIIRDLIQIDDRIVTCGEQVSIGCWYWNRQQIEV